MWTYEDSEYTESEDSMPIECEKIQIESEKIQCTLNLRRFNVNLSTLNLRRFNVHWISEDSMYTESQDSTYTESQKIQCESKHIEISEDSMCTESQKIQWTH